MIRRFSLLRFVLSSLILGSVACGCVSSGPAVYELPFRYKSMGVGEGAVHDELVVKPGSEQGAISSAILGGFQRLDHGVVDPSLSPSQALPEDTTIITDWSVLRPQDLEAHNVGHRQLGLSSDARYSLRYLLQYAVKERSFALLIRTELRRRGAAGDWHEYPRRYSNVFFADRLKEQIENDLKALNP